MTKPEEQQAAVKPPAHKREFRPLKTGDRIDRCSFILPSRLQCWKAGEEEIRETLTDGTVRTYQFCERHVRIQKALDSGALKDEQIATPLQEMTLEPPQSAPNFEAAPEGQTQAEQESPHLPQKEEPPKVDASKSTQQTQHTQEYYYKTPETSPKETSKHEEKK